MPGIAHSHSGLGPTLEAYSPPLQNGINRRPAFIWHRGSELRTSRFRTVHVVRDCPLMFGSLRERTKQLLHTNNNYYNSRSSNRSQGHELYLRSSNSTRKVNEQKTGRYEIDFLLSNVHLKTPTNYISELNSTSSQVLIFYSCGAPLSSRIYAPPWETDYLLTRDLSRPMVYEMWTEQCRTETAWLVKPWGW